MYRFILFARVNQVARVSW